MAGQNKLLDSINLVDVNTYLNPPPPTLSLASPARIFMTDFLQGHPAVLAGRQQLPMY